MWRLSRAFTKASQAVTFSTLAQKSLCARWYMSACSRAASGSAHGLSVLSGQQQLTWMASSSCGTLCASSDQGTVSLTPVSRRTSMHAWLCMSRGPSSSLIGTPCQHSLSSGHARAHLASVSSAAE